MAIDFPTNPSVGDKVTLAGQEYEFNGVGYEPVISAMGTKASVVDADRVIIQDSADGEFKTVTTDKLGTTLDLVTSKGNTTTNDISVGKLTSTEVQLSGGTGTQGTLTWNANEETLDLVNNGAVLQLGQEIHMHCRNATGVTIPDGVAVMHAGTVGASGRVLIAPMVADGSVRAHQFIGITTEALGNNEDGKVTTFGKIRGLDTSAWSDGDILYCDPAVPGGFTAVVPSAPNLKLPVAHVVNSHANNGTIVVDTPLVLNMHDGDKVEVLSPDANGDPQVDDSTLMWNSTAKRWENQTPTETKTALGVPSGSGNSTGTNTGDNSVNTLYSSLVSNVTTNLGYTPTATNGTVTSSDGTDATLPAATDSLAGLLTGADKAKLDGIEEGAAADLGYTIVPVDDKLVLDVTRPVLFSANLSTPKTCKLFLPTNGLQCVGEFSLELEYWYKDTVNVAGKGAAKIYVNAAVSNTTSRSGFFNTTTRVEGSHNLENLEFKLSWDVDGLYGDYSIVLQPNDTQVGSTALIKVNKFSFIGASNASAVLTYIAQNMAFLNYNATLGNGEFYALGIMGYYGYGPTTSRPTYGLVEGREYYDTDLNGYVAWKADKNLWEPVSPVVELRDSVSDVEYYRRPQHRFIDAGNYTTDGSVQSWSSGPPTNVRFNKNDVDGNPRDLVALFNGKNCAIYQGTVYKGKGLFTVGDAGTYYFVSYTLDTGESINTYGGAPDVYIEDLSIVNPLPNDADILKWDTAKSKFVAVAPAVSIDAPSDGTAYSRQDGGWVAGGALGRDIDVVQTGVLAAATTWLVDTSVARTRALPVGVDGDEIGFADDVGDASTNLITITPNGAEKIMGVNAAFTIATPFARGVLKFYAATSDWRLVP